MRAAILVFFISFSSFAENLKPVYQVRLKGISVHQEICYYGECKKKDSYDPSSGFTYQILKAENGLLYAERLSTFGLATSFAKHEPVLISLEGHFNWKGPYPHTNGVYGFINFSNREMGVWDQATGGSGYATHSVQTQSHKTEYWREY
jgi:hypothetical protein